MKAGGALSGTVAGAIVGVSDVSQLTRGTADNPDESSWDCIQRLASQVNWSAFSNGNTLYYMDGPTMAAQKPAVYLSLDDTGTVWTATNPIGDPPQTAVDVISNLTYTFDNCMWTETPIPTPSGWTTMGDLQQGDEVFGADGKPTKVVGVSKVHTGRDCYRVCFRDGTSIITDADHVWQTRSYQRISDRMNGGRLGLVTTTEIAETIKHTGGDGYTHRIDVTEPLCLPERDDLLIDPYIFGYWLGDGRSLGPIITCADDDLGSLTTEIDRAGYFYTQRECPRNGWARKVTWNVSISRNPGCVRGGSKADSLTGRLRQLDVFDNKHIPSSYLRASTEQRLATLQGLMDSDGSVGKYCCLQLSNERLAHDARELISSLGFRTHWSEKPPRGHNKKVAYVINFATRDHLTPFRLPRKVTKYTERLAAKTNGGSAHTRSIVAVEAVPSVPLKCILVEADDHLFLGGETMGVLHNTAFIYQTDQLKSGQIQKASRIATPQTPSQIQMDMVCGIVDYRAGDVFVFQNSGIIDGRWIVEDATRNCLQDIFTQLTLGPPTAPDLEPQATSTGAELSGNTGVGTMGGAVPANGQITAAAAGTGNGVAQAAEIALASKQEYVYSEVIALRGNNGTLFGPPPRTMDCSSFATLCYKAAGLPDPNHMNYNPIGNTTSLIAHSVKTSNPQPGSLCFFGNPGPPVTTVHVTVYVGNGQSISMGGPGDPSLIGSTVGPATFLGYYNPDVLPGGTASTSPAPPSFPAPTFVPGTSSTVPSLWVNP